MARRMDARWRCSDWLPETNAAGKGPGGVRQELSASPHLKSGIEADPCPPSGWDQQSHQGAG